MGWRWRMTVVFGDMLHLGICRIPGGGSHTIHSDLSSTGRTAAGEVTGLGLWDVRVGDANRNGALGLDDPQGLLTLQLYCNSS